MPGGFLLVFSEPGEQVSIEEFQDWYNNEHVPLRMDHLRSFLTGARYSAADSLKPSWAAVYDIDDTATFKNPSYTSLRESRSPREAALVSRLEILDRRTCELLSDSGESELTSSFASRNPTKFIVTHGVLLGEGQDFVSWTKNVFQTLKETKGWIRTRTYKCIDSGKTGTAYIGKGPEAQIVPQYLAVHELASAEDGETPQFKNVVQPPATDVKVVELRKWNLYRAYPGIFQGNIKK